MDEERHMQVGSLWHTGNGRRNNKVIHLIRSVRANSSVDGGLVGTTWCGQEVFDTCCTQTAYRGIPAPGDAPEQFVTCSKCLRQKAR